MMGFFRKESKTAPSAKPAPAEDRRNEFGSEDAEKKRRYTIRHNCQAKISMRIGYLIGGSQDWSAESVTTKGRVLDLSTLGAALFTRESFGDGQELQVTIKTRDGSKIKADGIVRWVRPIPDKGGYATGVEFTHVDSSDQMKIRNFLRDLDATLGL